MDVTKRFTAEYVGLNWYVRDNKKCKTFFGTAYGTKENAESIIRNHYIPTAPLWDAREAR